MDFKELSRLSEEDINKLYLDYNYGDDTFISGAVLYLRIYCSSTNRTIMRTEYYHQNDSTTCARDWPLGRCGTDAYYARYQCNDGTYAPYYCIENCR